MDESWLCGQGARGREAKYSRFKDADQWKLDSATKVIQGRQCRALSKIGPQGKESYWFDPSRRKAVLLYEFAAKDVVPFRQEIFYSEDPKYGLIPSRWTTERYMGHNVLIESTLVTVMHYEINKEYRDKSFDMTFPPGTEVRDDRENRFYRLGEDGSKQDIVR